jgi:hypothetical protein
MKITIITSNKSRHNYLINQLSKIATELYIIQECDTIFPGKLKGYYNSSKISEKYFKKVLHSQNKIFGSQHVILGNKGSFLSLKKGDLNKCSLLFLKDFLNSDYYVVFGSSFLKGPLVNFLVKKKALNIHMGISPFYRGADCNFWALNDNNYHLVGATIHLLSKGLDNGPILYHAVSERNSNLFDYSMLSVKSAILSIKEYIHSKKILKIKPTKVKKNLLLKYTNSKNFNDNVIEEFFKKKIIYKKMNLKILKDPFILKKKKFFTDN